MHNIFFTKNKYFRIEFGINRVLSSLPSTCGHVSVLQLSDMEMRLYRHVSDDLILRYSVINDRYMQMRIYNKNLNPLN